MNTALLMMSFMAGGDPVVVSNGSGCTNCGPTAAAPVYAPHYSGGYYPSYHGYGAPCCEEEEESGGFLARLRALCGKGDDAEECCPSYAVSSCDCPPAPQCPCPPAPACDCAPVHACDACADPCAEERKGFFARLVEKCFGGDEEEACCESYAPACDHCGNGGYYHGGYPYHGTVVAPNYAAPTYTAPAAPQGGPVPVQPLPNDAPAPVIEPMPGTDNAPGVIPADEGDTGRIGGFNPYPTVTPVAVPKIGLPLGGTVNPF